MSAAIRLAVVAAIAACAAGCSVDHRSNGFACTDGSNDCPDGRTCMDGFCVATGPIDAPTASDGSTTHVDAPLAIDAAVPDAAQSCPDICTSCDFGQMTCEINCTAEPAKCAALAGVTCPAGFNCDIRCNSTASCSSVDCSQSSGCTIDCARSHSCATVTCGTASCSVTCSGNMSCANVDCGDSCACDLTCGPSSSCNQVTCPSDQCTIFDQDPGLIDGCTSQPEGCNTCQ